MAGPFAPDEGLRFDHTKVLLDPYGRGVAVAKGYIRDAAAQPGDNAATAMKSVVVDPSTYDWEGDEPLRRAPARTIVYEMHVRAFTANPNSGVDEQLRGTTPAWSRRSRTSGTSASPPSSCPRVKRG